jgi:transposase-like protein
MTTHAETVLAALRAQREQYPDRVRNTVVPLIESGHVTQSDAARALGVSRPTLRKWLACDES